MNQPKPIIPERASNQMPPSKPLTKSELNKLRDKLNIPNGSLKDHIAAWLADEPDKVQWVGEAVIGYSGRYTGTLKYLIFGVGWGIKYAGKLIDDKIMRANEIGK